ncbi:hypothetical protein MTO96_031197 [Rhipicephalus appendiculatus]
MSSAPSSPHGSGSASPNSRSGDDVVYAAYFDFDHIATSPSDEESVEDGANADANDFGVVVDVAGGLPQWSQALRLAGSLGNLKNDTVLS